jgi:predicted N-formylglutamate amidohydrolase
MPERAATDNPSARDVVEVRNPAGDGSFMIVCEHASNSIPASYAGLGLVEAALESHIAWDPGALAVAETMSSQLDSPLIAQRFSRLLYDCNRPPSSQAAVPALSEVYPIPGNAGLSTTDRQARVDRFYTPFQDTLTDCLDQRIKAGFAPVIVTVHSFTPVYKGNRRAVELGILHDTDSRLADALLEATKDRAGLVIRRNEPYGAADGVTHTLIEHGVSRGLLNVMVEIRNNLIADKGSQTEMAEWLSICLTRALERLAGIPGEREIA